jgi:hypothetical protein
MTVVLTGDVHHHIPSSDRGHTTETEMELALEYADIAARHRLNVTLFVTGRCIVTERDRARRLSALKNVEIGGHGWDAFYPRKLYAALARMGASPHGPAWFQDRWTIRRTCSAVAGVTGKPVRSWRNHALQYDTNTPGLLTRAGIDVWSDVVDLASSGPYRHESGVTALPLNTLPDHDHMFHGDLTPEALGDDSGREVLPPERWYEHVCRRTTELAEAGGIVTILAHPLCMKVADDWATFERLCAFLSRFPSLFATEAADRALR